MFNKIAGILNRVAANSVISAIKSGLALTIPLIFAGSFAIMLNNLPIEIFQQTMTRLLGSHWKEIGVLLARGSYNIISLCILLAVSYSITQNSRQVREEKANTLIVCVVALGCLIILTEPLEGGVGVPFFWLSATGLFVAILTAVFSTLIFIKLSSIELLRLKAFSNELDSSLNKAIVGLLPAMLTMSIFAFIKWFFFWIGFPDIHRIVYDVVKTLFVNLDNNLQTALLFDFLTHLFWFFGVHGTNILEPVAIELYQPALAENAARAAAGLLPEHIFTKTFFDVFVYMGGCGSSLCLILAILTGVRKGSLTKIARLSIPSALFNINELIVFGLPIIFNPYYFLPFFLVPCLFTLTSFCAFYWELVPLTVNKVLWTTPIFIGGYITVNSYAGVALQLFNLILGTLVYLPFVRIAEKQRKEREKGLLQTFYQEVLSMENRAPSVLNRTDTAGSIARSIADDIRQDLRDDVFVMHYQPQIDNNGKVYGAEALLRWPHRHYGMVPPPVTVTIAEEAGLMNQLGDMTIRKVFGDVGIWHEDPLMKDLIISLNVSASQMETRRLEKVLINQLAESGAKPGNIDIVLTESRLLNYSEQSWHLLELFRQMGFRFAIDDFGMGHNSMRYLREFTVDIIKLDGSLTTEVLKDKNSRDIVASITQLARSLNLTIIAEFVETKEQMLLLKELGCHIYQGYYYSPALTAEKFVEFVKKNNPPPMPEASN